MRDVGQHEVRHVCGYVHVWHESTYMKFNSMTFDKYVCT
jgi:hypothetical protein